MVFTFARIEAHDKHSRTEKLVLDRPPSPCRLYVCHVELLDRAGRLRLPCLSLGLSPGLSLGLSRCHCTTHVLLSKKFSKKIV